MIVWGIIILFVVLMLWLEISNDKKIKKSREARLRALDIASVDNMDGISFEYYVAWLLKHKDFTEVMVTKGSNDYGADIIATKDDKKYSIQVKRYSSNISRRAISDAVGAKDYYGCNAAMVITNSYFSKNAKIFSNTVNCVLIDRDTLGSWILEISKDNNYEKIPYIEKDGAFKLERIDQAVKNTKNLEELRAIGKEIKQIELKEKLEDELEELEDEMDFNDDEFYEELYSDEIKRIKKIKKKLKKLESSSSIKLSQKDDISQIESYNELQQLDYNGISSEIVNQIKDHARQTWENNYSMQAHTLKNEIKGYRKIQQLDFNESSNLNSI